MSEERITGTDVLLGAHMCPNDMRDWVDRTVSRLENLETVNAALLEALQDLLDAVPYSDEIEEVRQQARTAIALAAEKEAAP